MSMLKSIQKSFYHSIFDADEGNLDFINSSYSADRFDVYRQTIFENLTNALRITFPGTWSLLGKECADTAAAAFFKGGKNRPTSGCLDDWGGDFPTFLGDIKQLADLAYLQDYASYEWIKHKVYWAQEGQAISVSELQSISEDMADKIAFIFIPAFYVYSSRFPIHQIQEIAENPGAEAITLSNRTPSYAVVARPEFQVATFWISQDLWTFISLLAQGKRLFDSAHETAQEFSDFDLTRAIHFLFQKQLISKIILPD